MRFWDSSAIIPLLCLEASSPAMQGLYRADPDLLVWAFTRTEVLSALCRRLREGSLLQDEFRAARERLRAIAADWTENVLLDAVLDRSDRLLEVHPLSAADSLQLAAALVSVEERPRDFPFVTLDDRLGDAASREGFRVEGA